MSVREPGVAIGVAGGRQLAERREAAASMRRAGHTRRWLTGWAGKAVECGSWNEEGGGG